MEEPYCFVQEASLKRLLTILLQLYDIPEKAKLDSEKISGSTSPRGRGIGGARGIFRTVKFPMIVTVGCMTSCVYQN